MSKPNASCAKSSESLMSGNSRRSSSSDGPAAVTVPCVGETSTTLSSSIDGTRLADQDRVASSAVTAALDHQRQVDEMQRPRRPHDDGVRAGCDLVVRDPLVELLEDEPQLTTGEMRAEAAADPTPQSQAAALG